MISAAGMPVPDGAERPALTLAEFAAWADPPIAQAALELIVRGIHTHDSARLAPVGRRRRQPGSPGGRPAATYDAAELMLLHRDLLRWLTGGDGRPSWAERFRAGWAAAIHTDKASAAAARAAWMAGRPRPPPPQ